MRVSTGIAKLDDMIGGGFPSHSSILIKGPPGTGKTTISQQFLYSGLKNSEKGYYITSDASPEDVVDKMSSFSWEIDSYLKSRKLLFLDIYSWRVGGAKDKVWKHVLQGGLNIDALNLSLSELLEKLSNDHHKRGVFDSLSSLLLYVSTDMVIKFIPILIAKAKRKGATELLILEEGVHDPKTVNTLNFLTDGLIETKMEEGTKYLRIPRMRGTSCKGGWIEYDLTDNGVVII
jgi:KaiC/GvpD/RAD55 family RecA-like ATPase